MRFLTRSLALGPAPRSGGPDRPSAQSGAGPGRAAGVDPRGGRPGGVGGRAGWAAVRGGGCNQPDAKGAGGLVGVARLVLPVTPLSLAGGCVLQTCLTASSLVVTRRCRPRRVSQAVETRERMPRRGSTVNHPTELRAVTVKDLVPSNPRSYGPGMGKAESQHSGPAREAALVR